MNSAHYDRATSDVRDLKNDALRHNCTHDLISEIMPGIFKLIFSGIRKMTTYFYCEN